LFHMVFGYISAAVVDIGSSSGPEHASAVAE
jgi:hypothetical protein